ncbi:DASH complex subunit DAD3 [Blastomyces parvus]|uniref:DASH complex subunit DAD3 n=1 Tax=Blastomyces parvus TaxID=2060905 RepID=A0A2B7XMW5_9EURO|nr:DASH complex subunit DAD3 [Blastomyces parvus]
MPRPASSLSARPISSSANDHDIDIDADIDPTAQGNHSNDAPAAITTGSTTEPTTTNPLLRENPLLSPLEQEVLDEYARLLGNMNKLSDSLAHLSARPAAETLDALRLLERKTATVCTLLKASVYSIVLQQQIYNGEDGGGRGGDGHGHQHTGDEGRYGGHGEGD